MFEIIYEGEMEPPTEEEALKAMEDHPEKFAYLNLWLKEKEYV